MNRMVTSLWVVLVGILCGTPATADEPPVQQAWGVAESRAFDLLKQSGRCPEQWGQAHPGTSRMLTTKQGKWQACSVSREEKNVGYILFFESPAGPVPVMYSGSEIPLTMVEQLIGPSEVTTLDAAPQIEGPADVPMVAVPKQRGDHSQISPLACCIAGMSMWVQGHDRLPLLYLVQEVAASRPFDTASPFFLPSPPPAPGELRSFYEQRATIYQDPKISEPLTLPASTQPGFAARSGSVTRVKDATILFDRMRPVVHSELMRDLSRQARWELMREEFLLAAETLVLPSSKGMVSAVVVQSYLTGTSPEQGLEDFVRSRGLRSLWSYSRPTELAPERIPCVLLGPENQAVLVTGLSTDLGTRWVVVTVPQTVLPLVRSREDVEAEMLAKFEANKAPGQPKGPVLPPMYQSAEGRQKFEELKRQAKAFKRPEENIKVLDDATTTLPHALGEGTHVARLDLFGEWKVLWVNVAVEH